MGRPKHFDDEFLLSCVDSFWNCRCSRNPRLFSYKSLSAFLAESENISVSADTLKHNKAVHERVDMLKAGSSAPVPAAPGTTAIPAAGIGNEQQASLLAELRQLSETNEKLKSFISRTYVRDICLTLIKEELSLQMETSLRNGVAERNVITANMAPFSSPVIMELAAMFNLEEDSNEKNE